MTAAREAADRRISELEAQAKNDSKEISQLKSQLNDAQAGRANLEGALKAAEEALAAAAKRANEQQTALAASAAEVERLTKALAAAKAAADADVERLKKELAAMTAARDAALKEGERLTAEGKQKDADNAVLKRRVAELEAALRQAQEALAAMSKVGTVPLRLVCRCRCVNYLPPLTPLPCFI